MDQRRTAFPRGVRPHGAGIQLKFVHPKGSGTYTYATLDWAPSPANLAKAGRLRQDIVDAVRHGTFRWRDFFPDDHRAAPVTHGTFFAFAQAWLNAPTHDWKPQTRYKWRGILNRVWIPSLDERPINTITLADLTTALAVAIETYKAERGKEPGKAIYNDWLTCARGVFAQAITAGAITRAANPAAELKNKKRDTTEPDPFDAAEADAIIADIYAHDGPMWGAWFEFGFYTGLRYPSEASALTWPSVDLRKGLARITQIHSKHARREDGYIQATTKTGVARTVQLNSRALHALAQVKPITKFTDAWVFVGPRGAPIIEGNAQRAMWRASLKRLGIRYRDPYAMRHTYASRCLMAGANPAFMARQLGHSIQEFFRTYATWIDRTNAELQMQLIEQGIGSTGAKVGRETG